MVRAAVWAVTFLVLTLLASMVAGAAADWAVVFERVESSIVRVTSGDGEAEGTCSGVVINERSGYVLTAAHCVDEDMDYTVAGRHAELVRQNRVLDLAVFRTELPKWATQIELALELPRTGEAVAVIGYGFGEEDLAIQTGVIAHPRTRNRTLVDANLLPGDSGGAIVDAQGRLVGVTSGFAFYFAAHQGFAVPIDTVRRFVDLYLPAQVAK